MDMSNDKKLIDILLRKEESKDLDYKGPCEWNSRNKASCCELVKDILALGNTLGGYLIIGVDEKPDGFVFTGLSSGQLASFDTTKINQFVNNYADPPINTTVYKVAHDNKHFAIISVPVFSDTPHICQKDYPGILSEATVYVRTDNNESAPIKKSSDFRLVIENSIKNRTDQLLTSFRSILKHGPQTSPSKTDDEKFTESIIKIQKFCDELNPVLDKSYGYRETIFYPSFFDDQYFEIDQLKTMAENGSVNYTGWPFIYYNQHDSKQSYIVDDGIETCLSGKNWMHGGDSFHFWRLFRTGLLYTKEILDEDSYLRIKGDNDPILDFDRLCLMAAKTIDCLTRIYTDHLPDETSITLKFRLSGLENRSIASLSGMRMFFRGHYVSKIKETEYMTRKPLAEWRAGVVDYSLELCKHVFLRFNWIEPNMDACKDVIDKMFKRKL